MRPSSLLAAAVCLLLLPVASAAAAGNHEGEAGKLSATVAFADPALWTTTNAQGTYFRYSWGGVSFAPKVYQPQHWGTFPGYFLGSTMRFTVTLKNTAAKGAKPFTVRVQALSNVLEVDGGLGQAIGPGQEWIVAKLLPGETRVLSGEVLLAGPLPSGLDITRIRIAHLNQGNNPDAGLITVASALWCPPEGDDVLLPPSANN